MADEATAKSYHSMSMSLSRLFGDSDPHSWEELQELENRRRAILKRVELPFWRVLCYFDGTVLHVLVTDVLLWATFAIYVLVRYESISDNLPAFFMDLDDTNIDIMGGFLSFFLVLFVNQSNIRFNSMYKDSMGCVTKIEDIAYVVNTYFPKANANRIVRFMNAAHAAGYVGLASDTYSMNSFFMKLNNEYRFLTKKELDRVVEIGMEEGSDCMRELLMWAIKEIKVAQDEKIIDPRTSGEIRNHVQSFRGYMGSLFDYKDQPIHFFYIHFLSLLTAVYLPLFAITTAYSLGEGTWTSEIVQALIVFLQCVFVIGLRMLGQVMVDPYGDDLEDLSVLTYIREAWKSSNRILDTKFPGDLDASVEEENMKTRADLGSAW